jgi:hypothetical protein
MADMAVKAKYFGDILAAHYPHFPPAMHKEKYWMDWAARYTSPGWPYFMQARNDKSHEDAYLREGAKKGDPASIHHSAEPHLRAILTMLAADEGYAPAAYEVHGWYRYGANFWSRQYIVLPDLKKSDHYLRIALEGGYWNVLADLTYYALLNAENNTVNMEDIYFFNYLFDGLGYPGGDSGYIYEKAHIELLRGVNIVQQEQELIPPLAIKLIVSQIRPHNSPEALAQIELNRKKIYAEYDFAISPEQHARARQRAAQWIDDFRERELEKLEKERVRRAALTVELREECAIAVANVEFVRTMKLINKSIYDR